MDSNVFHKLTKKLHTQVDEHMLEVGLLHIFE
jgi:hypothetical protein